MEPLDSIMYFLRSRRQSKVFAWAVSTFGDIAKDPKERANRFIEEAIELAQALGVDKNEVYRIVNYVYNRLPGSTFQEVGGVSLTLMALCESIGMQADDAEAHEIARVLSADKSKFRAKQNVKAEAGIGKKVS